jgi:glycerol-3-phosphate cytidylyltransferase
MKIVLTNGCFDMIHLGHVKILEMARSLGDILIIGLNSDSSVRRLKGHGHPIMFEMDRAEIISALRYVDYVTIFSETTAENLIRNIKPNVYVKGGDYGKSSCKEMALVKEYGGEVIVLPYIPGKSSTLLINKILKFYANNGLQVSKGGDNS